MVGTGKKPQRPRLHRRHTQHQDVVQLIARPCLDRVGHRDLRIRSEQDPLVDVEEAVGLAEAEAQGGFVG